MPRLVDLALPDYGHDDEAPAVPIAEHERRLAELAARARARGLDAVVVYGDREHAANLAYLVGVEPRFEEAALVLTADGGRALIVGNECLGYLPDERLGVRAALYQDFSLMGQPRDRSRPLADTLRDAGVPSGRRIGAIGWKRYDPRLVGDAEHALDLPSYLADALRELAGSRERVVNAIDLLADPRDGMRVRNGAAEIARFEHAAGVASRGVLAAVRGIRPGAREREVAAAFASEGLPLSCHPMTSFGAKAARGLSSPGDGRARVGDAFTLAFGVWGALSARAGVVASDASELDAALRDFYPRFVATYFAVIAAWYGAVRVGATGGEVFAAVEARRDPALFSFALNPGHYLHLDEWVHSPFAPGDRTPLPSGAALQMDIIPVPSGPSCCSNGEDGIALADAPLRAELARGWPRTWERIQRRREFLGRDVGIAVDESVLPLSDSIGWLAPYALAPHRAFVVR